MTSLPRRRVLLLAALLAAAGLAPHAHATPTGLPGVDNLLNIIDGDKCSMSVVRFDVSQPTDKALVMTNGHCLQGDKLGFNGEFKANQAVNAQFDLLDATAENRTTLTSTRLVYATITSTDLAFYELDQTYAQLTQAHQASGLTLARTGPKLGTTVVIASGYWTEHYRCTIDRTPLGVWIDGPHAWWQAPAYGYSHGKTCRTVGGSSGSPVLDAATGHVVAVSNSSNGATIPADGCTGTATCEVDAAGQTVVKASTGYSAPTALVYTCLTANRQIDVTVPGCQLPGGDSPVKRPW